MRVEDALNAILVTKNYSLFVIYLDHRSSIKMLLIMVMFLCCWWFDRRAGWNLLCCDCEISQLFSVKEEEEYLSRAFWLWKIWVVISFMFNLLGRSCVVLSSAVPL